MSFFDVCKIENIHLSSVNIRDDNFKISKPVITEKLRNSIKNNGLLDKPVLFNDKGKYVTICGHNRLTVLRELNTPFCISIIIDTLDPKDFTCYALLKNYRDEIGCIGKIKFIRILKNKFRMDDKDIHFTARKMQIPEEFLDNDVIEKALHLPLLIKDYIDSRDLGFKILKNILFMPDDVLLLISAWLKDSDIRINIFKGIIDLVFDIYKRDRSAARLKDIDFALFKDKREREDFLYREIYNIRYPEFSDIKSRAGDLIGNFAGNGIKIGFPEFLEKDELEIILKINKRDSIELFKRKLNQIDLNAVKELLDLL